MTIVDKARNPYFDDFNEDKQYYEVLFVPQRAVQVRELNQLQSMFYEQIGRFGNHIFKDGSVVIPGETNYDLDLKYVAVSIANYDNVVQQLVNENVTLESSDGITANVKIFRQPEDTDPAVFYVEYLSSDTVTGEENIFADSSTISVKDNGVEFTTATVQSTGTASKFTIANGVWYINQRFVLVPQETVLLDKFSNSPSKIVCIEYNEKLVTENTDSSLFDNAQGTPNFSAPGAHRLGIDVNLKVFDLSELETLPDNMVEIFRIKSGEVQKKVEKPDYAVLNDVMAQRTYEESGDYTVNAFNVTFKDHPEVYPSAPDSDKFVAQVSEGLAYVRGYRIENLATKNISVDKARTTSIFNNNATSAELGYYIEVSGMNIVPNTSQLQEITFYDTAITTAGELPSGNALGTARVRFVREDGGNHRLYLFDVRNASGDRSTAFIANALSVYSSVGKPFSADLVDPVLYEPAANSLLFDLNLDFVKSLYDDQGNSDTSYVSVDQVDTATDTNGGVTLSASSNEIYTAQDSIYAFASFTDTGEFANVVDNYTLSGTPTGSVISIDFGSANAGRPVRMNLQVAKSGIKQKTKTTQQGTASGSLDGDGRLYLNKADAYSLVSVIDDDAVDVTSKFSLVANKTPSMYDVSYVTGPTTGVTYPVTVTFNHFVHSAGDFFGPDSYVDIAYEDIQSENGVRLSDIIDFRPRIADDRSGFNGSGASVGNIPTPYTIIRNDVEYYLPRIDKVYVNANGSFGVKQGSPSLDPNEPEDPSDSMILYIVNVPPYTFDLKDISAERINNRRYTMKDIGQLENRVANVEYYVTLNMLEQETESKQIIDPTTGLNRFKNGFLVDNFIDHSVGNFVWDGYHISIDSENQEMRPEFSLNAFDLEINTADSKNIVENNGIVTLPYTDVSFIKQNLRSNLMNVNPYAVFFWDGSISLVPSIDSWIDTEYTEPEVTYRLFNNGRLTQQWNSWGLNWIGGTTRTSRTSQVTSPSHSELQTADNREPGVAGTRFAGRNVMRRSTRTFQTTTTTRTNIDVVNDRIIDRSVIPYMRSIQVNVEGIGNRPKSRMYFFFDNIDVNSYVKPSGGSYGQPVVTDVGGNFDAVFKIPNDDQLKFKTGEKQLIVTDNADNNRELSTSYGDAVFTSTGIRNVRRRTIVATRSISTNTRQVAVRWYDPLAQSFLVERDGGVFITKIDIFLKYKDERVPITVQLREMENGAPTQTVIPGGEKTLNPSNVNTSPDGSVATTFEFPYPVYLQDGQEYCFAIMSNSNKYKAFIARMGENDLVTNKYISKQPYAGVMFKSQNNSTWTPDQTSDLQFEIHSAKFDISTNGSLILNNADFDNIRLPMNSIETVSGSADVIVHKQQHNYPVGCNVVLSGAIGGNGITDAELNQAHTVKEVLTPNKFSVTVTNTATASGFVGGSSTEISNTVQASLLNPNVPSLELSGTAIRYEAKGTIGQSIDGNESLYTSSDYIQLSNQEQNKLAEPWIITNAADETANLSGNKSIEMRITMGSENDSLSPVIDMQGNSVIAPFILIDKKQATETNGSNNWANYVTRITGLANAANALKVYIDALKPQNADIIMTARFGNSIEEVQEATWQLLDSVNIQTTGDTEEFLENEYGLEGLSDYTQYQVMIQMKSDSSTNYPICKRLRVIALGT